MTPRKHHPWTTPVTVYTFDRKSNRYVLSGCMVCQIPSRKFPAELDCKSVEWLQRENIELLKTALRSPAVVLINGTHMTAFCASGDEWKTPLPAMHDAKHRIVRAYEFKCINYTTRLINYRLRHDGTLVLSSESEVNCGTYYVPETLSMDSLKIHLKTRADCIKKTLRDRRIIVQLSDERSCVYSVETMHRRHVIDSSS